MRLHSHHLELLSPARDAAIAREAILDRKSTRLNSSHTN